MGIDTVKIKSPYLTTAIMKKIEAQGDTLIRRNNDSGEVTWELTKTTLQGSYDSRIMIRPMHEEAVKNSRNGRPEWKPSPPYIFVECSIPKAFYGQNIYGAIEDFQQACQDLIVLLRGLLDVKLPDAATWKVYRIDWAENYRLPFEAIQEYFEGIYTIQFPRRKVVKYGDEAIHIPGTTTTIKIYHKGKEFAKHDSKRLYFWYREEFRRQSPRSQASSRNHYFAARKVEALQRLANSRLRFEVELHAPKLDHEFGHRPRVSEVTTQFLQSMYDHEVQRLLREGKNSIQTVRTSREVMERLTEHYEGILVSRLHGFWHLLATHGEKAAREAHTKPTFYRNRKQLSDAGISWHGTDVQIIARQGNSLPVDFSPVRSDPRRCIGRVREIPAILKERGFTQLAA